jgi:hypothetical protein
VNLVQQDQDSFLSDILELLENQEKIKERADYFLLYFERNFEAREVQRQLLQMLEELQNNR